MAFAALAGLQAGQGASRGPPPDSAQDSVYATPALRALKSIQDACVETGTPVSVCGEDVATTKPAPEPYLLAAKLLDADPEQCVALEDSPSGVASATGAGCLVVAVPTLLPIPAAPTRLVARRPAHARSAWYP